MTDMSYDGIMNYDGMASLARSISQSYSDKVADSYQMEKMRMSLGKNNPLKPSDNKSYATIDDMTYNPSKKGTAPVIANPSNILKSVSPSSSYSKSA